MYSLATENLRLAWDLACRDLAAKYKRSVAGPLWLLLTPLGLLGIYWLVFGVVFGVEWQRPHGVVDGMHIGFLLPFFSGLVAYLAFADVVTSSSVLFAAKRTYVLKSPFPIWVLWIANLLRAGVHAGITLGLLLIAAVLQQRLSLAGAGWLVVSLTLCIIFMAAVSLLVAALGPFIGDISDGLRLLLRILFYATPITYPLALVPPAWRDWLWLNPLTTMVEMIRASVVFGSAPPYAVMLTFAGTSLVVALLAAWVFHRVKGVIADVV